jgi:hypothetical protein
MNNYDPLRIVNKREVKVLPRHFNKIEIVNDNLIDNVDDIKEWILLRLYGRFCLLKTPSVRDGRLQIVNVAAFEIARELTFFTIACPYVFKG